MGGFIGYTSLWKKSGQARFVVRGIFGSEWLVFTPGVQDVSILISVFSGEPYLQLKVTIQVFSLLDSSLPAAVRKCF